MKKVRLVPSKERPMIDAMSKIEEVRNVISNVLFNTINVTDDSGSLDKAARAAIEAMREPTEEMVDEMYEWLFGADEPEISSSWPETHRDRIKPAVRAMCHAALGKDRT